MVVVGALYTTGATVCFVFISGASTENFSDGEDTAPYVLTLEFDVMMTAGGCCLFRSKFFDINLSRNMPLILFNSSELFVLISPFSSIELSPSVFTMLYDMDCTFSFSCSN